MNKIRRDFIVRQLRMLAVFMAMMAVALGYIIFYAGISPLAFALIPLIVIAFVLRMQRQVSGSFRRGCGQYSELWKDRLEKEYGSPHPVYKVAYGEIHLLDTCLVCRNKGRLIFIPMEQIVRVEERFFYVSVKKVPLLKFSLDTDKTVSIEFSAGRTKDGAAVLSCLTERLGPEKPAPRQNAVDPGAYFCPLSRLIAPQVNRMTYTPYNIPPSAI